MNRKGSRPIFFVCIALSKESELITKIISSDSQNEAKDLFFKQTTLKALEILGPFYKKRNQVIENTRVLKFSDKTYKAQFNDWLVNAFLLKEPENHAYLVFIKRLDNKKQSIPKGTIIVPISDLRICDV